MKTEMRKTTTTAKVAVLCVLIVALCHVQRAGAWWQVGHMLTATVAQRELLRLNATIFERAQEIIFALNNLSDQNTHSFIEAAVWPDDIKTQATNFWDNWHFYDRPVNQDGLYIMLDEIQSKQNSVQALEQARLVLQGQTAGNATLAMAIMMRYVLHVIGDMHQPLHNCNMFNKTYTTGDLGGNLEKVIDLVNYTLPLHSFWDSGAEQFEFPKTQWTPLVRPLNNTGIQLINEWAQFIMDQFPREYFQKRIEEHNTPSQWTEEGWLIAQDLVYPPFKETNMITPQYQQIARVIIRQQIALGGYRLADFIISLFGQKNEGETETTTNFVEEAERIVGDESRIQYNPQFLNDFLKSKMDPSRKSAASYNSPVVKENVNLLE